MYKPSSALQQKVTIGFVNCSDDIPGSFLPVFSFNGFQIGEPQTISHKSGRSGSIRIVCLARLAPVDDVVRLFHNIIWALDTGKVVHPKLDILPISLTVLVVVAVRLRVKERLVA